MAFHNLFSSPDCVFKFLCLYLQSYHGCFRQLRSNSQLGCDLDCPRQVTQGLEKLAKFNFAKLNTAELNTVLFCSNLFYVSYYSQQMCISEEGSQKPRSKDRLAWSGAIPASLSDGSKTL